MSAATDPASHVPFLVLPHPLGRQVPRLSAATCALWRGAQDALAAVVASAEAGEPLGTPLAQARDATAHLAQAVAAEVGAPDPADFAPPVPVHSDYFRIRHAELSAEHQAQACAVVVFRTVADLRYAHLDVNDLISEVHGLAALLTRLGPGPQEPAGALRSVRQARPAGFAPSGNWLDRWFLVHHTYFLLNIVAADELDRAAGQVRAGNSSEAALTLDGVAVLIRAFTAGMVHSAAMPARFYQDVVRPTMAPPALPIKLTGVMQLEHRRFRRALRRFLAALPQPYDELAGESAELAAARGAVLEADLVDVERHVLVADALVGTERSLVQRTSTAVNATSALREMRHVRASVYAPLMEFGDRWLAAKAA